MAKLLLILILGGVLANSFAGSNSQPPLLIDSHPTPTHVAIDASN